MSETVSNATERQKKAFGLLLRRLSENAGLTNSQNALRDQIYHMASTGQFGDAFEINHRLLLEVGNADAEGAASDEAPAHFLSRFFKRPDVADPNLPAVFQSRERQLSTLALDRAVLLGMSGQPGEANDLLDKLMEARGEDPGNHMAEEIFEAALGLADLSASTSRRHQILHARMSFFFDMALQDGDDEKLRTALQAGELLHCDLAALDDVADHPEAVRTCADMMLQFGRSHERTGMLKSASIMLSAAAQSLRKSGQIKQSYELVVESLHAEIALAGLMGDASELAVLSKRLRDIVDLPDTMLTTETRGQTRYFLGTCLARQADIDGRIVTLRKAFGYFEAAAKQFAEIGLEAKELKSLRDLALAKVTAAELLALNRDNSDTDLVLAQRYNAEALQLQQELSARLG
uniref:hypothetical protein n=1 Tax=Pararhizobium sp. IMCC3301 TaxID=3067904 RepID=UPI0027429C2B|nr:hypothetical protein [Pararhizobium sp. IMCC3301]